MMTVPNDETFVGFVTDLRHAGMSSASIAAALNTSPWAGENGARWNGKQVADLCWASESEPIGVDAAPVHKRGLTVAGQDVSVVSPAMCDRSDCRYHRRQSVLRAIRNWSPFDPDACRMIASSYQNHESAETIAARLNRANYDAPTGRRWSGALVRAVAHIYSVDWHEGDAVPTLDDVAA